MSTGLFIAVNVSVSADDVIASCKKVNEGDEGNACQLDEHVGRVVDLCVSPDDIQNDL